MRSPRILIATLTAAALLLSACGGDEPTPEEQQAAAAKEKEAQTWPLTGLPVEKGSGAQDRPALVVKMDNTAASAPQVGLGSADLVVEELVEGGSTRLAAFYYSQVPGQVGPVRSMRASDIGIVAPVDGEMVTSGAAGQTIARIQDAGLSFVQEGAAGFSRDSARSAPYNLFADLGVVADEAQQKKARPDDYLPWGEKGDLPGGQPATTIAAEFSAGHTTSWSFADGGYTNVDSFAADGDEFPADTVLVLRVRVGDAGYTDPAGNPVPETEFEGDGEALLFHDGRVVRGTWSKDGAAGALELSTKSGDLSVPAGRTWVELVPAEGGDVTFQ